MRVKARCSIDGCSNQAAARGWCKMHWTRWRKHGDPNKGAKPLLGDDCSVPGCERKPHTRWSGRPVCNMHWQRLYKHGSHHEREKVFGGWAICSVDGCDKDSRSPGSGHCEMHYMRLRRTGTIEPRTESSVARVNDMGYVFSYDKSHPISSKSGLLYEHRRVLFEEIGEGLHSCHWCARDIEWGAKGGNKLVVDHLDGNKQNNAIENLVASCHRCNSTRGLFQRWVVEHKDDPFLWMLFREYMSVAA